MGLNIVLVDTWKVINSKGGAERVFCDMANALEIMGHSVTAICLDLLADGRPGFPLSENVRFINAGKFARPVFSRGIFKNIRAFSFRKEVRKKKREAIDFEWKSKLLSKAIKSVGKVDLYISFQPRATCLLANLRRGKAPVITMLHLEPRNFFSEIEIELTKKALRTSSLITVLLPSYINEVNRFYSKTPVLAIPNAIPSYIKAATLQETKIICIGRVATQKRIELLLSAFALIKDEIPEWYIEHWGEIDVEPEYYESLLQLSNSLGVGQRFSFCGPTNNIEEVLEGASIFAFPSAFEGFPLALGEAMSKGLPVIGCRDCSGTNEIIEDKVNGILTEPTPEKFSIALKLLAKDSLLRLKLGGRARDDIKKYSPESVWKKWNDIVCCVVAEREINI